MELSEDKKSKLQKLFESFKTRKFSNEDFKKIFDNKSEIIKKATTDTLSKYKEDIVLWVQMLNDFFHKRYQEIPFATIAATIGVILYLVNPFDLIPDPLFGVGLLDDALLIALNLKFISLDIEKYKKWRQTQKDLDDLFREE